MQFVDGENRARRFLLDGAVTVWHSVEHQWGSGHPVTDRGAARWHTPAAHTLTGDPAFHDAAEERLPWLPAFGGRPAHTADPLANDQDWHLVL
ncbi:hypothetical protein [Streptomyces camelliae]|uniref:Uncharacterized protein n=1 Tax=Streptomyces camelliae TaxID=3004093 RepID=A0ABY7P2J1_9ACTN|nr:hypothetical protein [Streptomyces sp. HUAS 2-6]WBO63041.1 hypothetical protein O1G22_09505 [Streptomyces sp. HUAS 2-6]